jgi:hypothetical protein
LRATIVSSSFIHFLWNAVKEIWRNWMERSREVPHEKSEEGAWNQRDLQCVEKTAG